MSELKYYKLLHRTSALTSPQFLSVAEFGNSDEVYLKSEADKIIEELEESHKKEVGQLLIEIAELKADYKEACDRLHTANLIKDEQLAAARHHKYKRCLAMARWCRECSWSKCIEKVYFYYKWYNRWLEIADQFKET